MKLVGVGGSVARRTWAVEGAAGLGGLLAQQLRSRQASRVLDVQPKLAARVRLLEAGDTNKNDPDDALSVAVAALRSKASREVTADDYTAVLKVWSKRHRDLSRRSNQVALPPARGALRADPRWSLRRRSPQLRLQRSWTQLAPSDAVALARAELAAEFLSGHSPPQSRSATPKRS